MDQDNLMGAVIGFVFFVAVMMILLTNCSVSLSCGQMGEHMHDNPEDPNMWSHVYTTQGRLVQPIAHRPHGTFIWDSWADTPGY